MNKLFSISSLLLALLTSTSAVAEPVVVIVNSANAQAVSQADVKAIYNDKSNAWANGEKITAYNLPPEDAAAEKFASKVLGSSARDAAAAESNRAVTNTSRNPQQTKRDALVASMVAKTPSAIGYVPKLSAEGKTGVKVLFTLE